MAKLRTPAGCFKTPVLIYHKTASVHHEILIGMNVLKHSNIDFISRVITYTLDDNTPTIDDDQNCIEIDMTDTAINCTSSESKKALTHATNLMQQAEAPMPRSRIRNPSNQSEINTARPHGKSTRDIFQSVGNQREIPVYLRSDLTIGKNTLMLATVPVNKQLQNGTDIILPRKQLTDNVVLASVATTVSNNCITVNLVNISNEPATLSPGTKLGPAEILYETNIVGSQSENINMASTAEPNDTPSDINERRPRITSKDINCDDPRFSEKVLHELNVYRDACWLPGEPLGKYSADQLEIRLKEHHIINKAPYRVPFAYQSKLDDYIKKLLAEGTITRSKSNFNSPLIIVKRGDGDIRPCIDYRELNTFDDTGFVSFAQHIRCLKFARSVRLYIYPRSGLGLPSMRN